MEAVTVDPQVGAIEMGHGGREGEVQRVEDPVSH